MVYVEFSLSGLKSAGTVSQTCSSFCVGDPDYVYSCEVECRPAEGSRSSLIDENILRAALEQQLQQAPLLGPLPLWAVATRDVQHNVIVAQRCYR